MPTLNIEIDGKPVSVNHGSTVMDAAQQLGIYVPHFCYHKKLSIAANCRMCLVQVEKAPKPLPACATPVTDGMKVWTRSEQAVKAQQGVMEFLLINHPLDCPICDQGGECQLQDLAVGYGGSTSRYQEAKRVVLHKNLGPLVSAEEMSRCIQCTRCVRFGQEIAGTMELGMIGRGEHSEIVAFVGRSVDSELSGNMIDLCPVGALTSRPFRYSARTWELSRRKSIAPHDALGSNLVVQVKGDRVLRVLPRENEAVNECWISDKDRFSYEALNGDDRLTAPMIRQGGAWQTVDWPTALEFVARGLRDVTARHGGASLATVVSPHQTLEEMALAARLTRALGSDNVDCRLRQCDFRGDGKGAGVPWLGMPIAAVGTLDRVLVVGSLLRKEHPLLAQRLRQAARKGAELSLLNPVGDDPLARVRHALVVAPSLMPLALAEIVVAAARGAGQPVPPALASIEPGATAEAIAASLATGSAKAVLLGNLAEQHRDASQLLALAQELARLTGATLGCLGAAANSVGGHLAEALPRAGGLDAQRMFAEPRRAYLVVGAEPEFDCADPVAARAALDQADFVVVLSPFRHGLAYADALLPMAPFTETAGTFVNCEGRAQSFNGVVKPAGETRPGWKLLRALGSLLELPEFAFDTVEDVRRTLPAAADAAARLGNGTRVELVRPAATVAGIERVADVPIHFADPIVRRAPALQQTADARPPRARMNALTLQRLGIADGAPVRLRQGQGEARLVALADATVPPGVVRVAAAHPSTCGLGGLSGPIGVEPA
ncbi:MAG: NADH-quinone oxidoreductase subunit G [Betaproteobacteria bacterium]|jgi:NADH-quinone oxidoreductase subunit G|nr:NADH-quinone oxidoreductase subunit G [Betaproteobacteria bacterium]MBK7081239.1 NADH-quinone oxidoreductase subunit G [Betaproteobacteria bacterium]MBK8687058.1 NADH-quinone oxidoreductase subunit G [Betaproteobacteria bacterium]